MTSRVAARVILLIAIAALIWIGIGFAGYGLLLAFLPTLGPLWSALATAALLLLLPSVIALVAFYVHGWQSAPAQSVAPEARPENFGLSALAGMAKDKPLLAVLFAGILGAAGAMAQHKDR